MIYYDGRKWQPCTWVVTFQDRGQERTKYIKDRERYERLEEMHDHIIDMSFEKLEFTDDQNDRLEEIIGAGLPEGFGSIGRKYVETGKFPEGYNHPLEYLKIAKEQSDQDENIADAFYEIMKVVE